MRSFRECTSPGAQLNAETVNIGIYTNPGLSLYESLLLAKQWSGNPPQIQNTAGAIPCIVGDVNVCYQIGIFSATVDLPITADGYTLSWVRYSRQELTNINDDPNPDFAVGATFITKIPGTNQLPTGHNSSPQFVVKDTAIVCADRDFKIDFSATDADNDMLSYSFCAAYNGGSFLDPDPNPTDFLNLVPLNYTFPYNGSIPMGPGVSIDPVTGLIEGRAPAIPGKYVICVCVTEWRNNVPINTHRKDFIVKVADCDFTAAELQPDYITCDGFSLVFKNESISSNIHSYYWDFGVNGIFTDTSTKPTPFYSYSDTGVYLLKLVVNRGEPCSDSTTAPVSIFPGFIPDFNQNGTCVKNDFNFSDLTFTKYGVVDSWSWDFGDLTSIGDTSHKQNPAYRYSLPSTPVVKLIVTNSKGCIDSISKPIEVPAEPNVTLGFTDTLICHLDTLQLVSSAVGTPSFSWQPSYNIINPNSSQPSVYPKVTTTYLLTVGDNGCTRTVPVTVNVTDSVYLNIGKDSTICATDTIQFSPYTNGLYYAWSPPVGLSNTGILDPYAIPLSNTSYILNASVGKCNRKDTINITSIPYPGSNAGMDTAICFGKTILLHGAINGSRFYWDPVNTLLNENTLTPTAGPQNTTAYTLKVFDTLGCPKPTTDTILVKVIPRVQAFAGYDTSIVVNQPLQLNATGGTYYAWSPSVYMNNPAIPNPVVVIGPGTTDVITYNVKVSTPEGCVGYDNITIHLFETKPELFIPTGFTPNGDGRNDVLKPTIAGMKAFLYFRIYDRRGNLLYSTSDYGQGWDGTFNSQQQPPGTYVFAAETIDYKGNRILRKGTVVLIR